MKWNPKELDKCFKRLVVRPYHVGEYFVLHDKNGSDMAEIFYNNGYWLIIKDNFPAPRTSYQTNFPIRSAGEFIVEMNRINLCFELL